MFTYLASHDRPESPRRFLKYRRGRRPAIHPLRTHRHDDMEPPARACQVHGGEIVLLVDVDGRPLGQSLDGLAQVEGLYEETRGGLERARLLRRRIEHDRPGDDG